MELFRNAKAVCLRGPGGWYLHASEGGVSVTAKRDVLGLSVRWSVEVVDANNIRLRSYYGKYLTGLPDNVFQSPSEDLSPSANWEPISEGGNNQLVRLKTSGGYLLIDRGTGSLPSGHNTRVVYLIRNPKRNRATKDGTPWEVVVVEWMGLPSPYYSATSSGFTRKKLSEILATNERVIFYRIANEFGSVDEGSEESNITFKGSVAHELTQRLEDKTGLRDIILCSLNALNGKLYRLHSLLPPYMIMHVVIVQSSSKFAVESGLLHVEKGREPEVKRSMDEKDSVESGLLHVEKGRDPEVTSSMDKKDSVESGLLHVEKGKLPDGKWSVDKKGNTINNPFSLEKLLLPRPVRGSVKEQMVQYVLSSIEKSSIKRKQTSREKEQKLKVVEELGLAKYDPLIQLNMNALQGQKLSAAEKQIVENMIGKCSDRYKEEKLKEILWLEGNEGVGLSSISQHETEALKKLRKEAWELKRKFDLLVIFLYPMKTNSTEESLAFTVGKFPVSNYLIRRIKASILTKNGTGVIKEETMFDGLDLSTTESLLDLPVSASPQLFFTNLKHHFCEVEKDLDKYDFDIATCLPQDMVENMKDPPPGIDMNYSTSSTKPVELTISSTSTKSANATRTCEEKITVSQHEIDKFTVNSAVQQVVKYFEARRNGKIGISGSGWEDVTKALKELPKIRNMFDIVHNVSLSNYESIIQLQQNVEEVQGPSSVHSSLGMPSRILLLVDYIDQRIDVDDLEFFDFADSVCIVLKTRPENVNEILAMNLEIRLEDCLLPWNLFCNNVGRVIVDSYELQEKALRLVEECHGNLLAIILLARILKGTKDYSVWELALHEIMCQQSSQFPQRTGVILINILRFAWERMRTDAAKQNCIRYCLLQNGNKIDREALIYQGVRSGWIETVNKGEDVLKELTSSFLLENIDEYIFLMREEIRLALMNILVVGNLPSYLDHGDIGPTKRPEMVKWIDKELNQMNSKLSELPECPYCPSLEKLSLQQNYDLMVIPSSFFLCMPALKVLNLSYTSIKSLPKSISKLVNLEEFFLRGCDLLMELPIEIGELEKLELFDLEGTPLSYLPEEIGKIDQLKSLKITLNAPANLTWKSKDVSRIVPMKYFSERTQFKELSIDVHPDGNWWDIEVTSILSELASFKCLNTLKLYLPNVEALKHIRWYGTTLIHPALECFRIIVGHYCSLSRIPHELEVEFNNLEKFEKGLKYMNGKGIMPEISKLLKRVSAVALERHWVLKNLSELGLRNMSNLKFCCLAECNELQTIIDSEQICQEDLEKDDSDESESGSESECEEESVLSSLQYLSIHYMKKLESICRGRVSKTCLSSLKSMALHTCLSLTTIFTKEILDNLKNLKELIVEDCPKISSLVSPECSNSTSDEYLPSLKKLSLLELPELVNVSNGLCIAPRLKSMVIFYCPKLNILSSTDVSSRNLDVFKGEEEWWHVLEWNEQDTDHKYYLAGKFTPLSRDMDLMADLAKIRLTTTL